MRGFTARRARPMLGTYVEVACRAIDEARAFAACEIAFSAIDRVHQLMSQQLSTSDVARLNAHAHRGPVAVAPETFAVLSAALKFHRASGGAFDIVCGARGNSSDITLHDDGRVRFRRRLEIDLGGIAKGQAVDAAIEALAALGIAHAIVNAGGDLRVLGNEAHTVHLRDPRAPSQTFPALRLAHGALATSGTYFDRALHDGVTRKACLARGSVTVVAATAIAADALTKIALLRPTDCAGILAKYGARALRLGHRRGALALQWSPPAPG